MELLKTMRCTNHTPILVLTAPLTSEEIITLLNAGADTYLEKPLNIEVCVAQANALMRLYIDSDINHEQHQPLIRGAELIISPRYRQVMVDGKPLGLSRKEFDLLHCLAAYPGQVFSREQIYSHIRSMVISNPRRTNGLGFPIRRRPRWYSGCSTGMQRDSPPRK